jgi:ribosomal protein L37E
MTVLDDVSALITRLSPAPICDDCVASTLGLSVRQHANHKARELAGANGFERRKDVCSLCGGTKTVTRRT